MSTNQSRGRDDATHTIEQVVAAWSQAFSNLVVSVAPACDAARRLGKVLPEVAPRVSVEDASVQRQRVTFIRLPH